MSDETLVSWFLRTAVKYPDRIAVKDEEGTYSYKLLEETSRAYGHRLHLLGAKPGDLVGLYVERRFELVMGILAILRAGCAYVPLDPTLPKERLEDMINDSGMKMIVTTLDMHPPKSIDLLDIDDFCETPPDEFDHSTPDGIAYVLYTSGSTGKPKGCMVTERNVVRLFTTTESLYNFGKDDVWTMFHSCAFDFSVWEMWGALLYGGKLIIVPYMTSRDPDKFLDLLLEEGVTVLNQTPGAFYKLIDAVLKQRTDVEYKMTLRYVIFGGERLDFAALKPWVDAFDLIGPILVNMYGITETTVHVTYRPITREDLTSTKSLIGNPLPDLHIYLLDAEMQFVPPGQVGEMYVGGMGVSNGYLNRPELTAERFIPCLNGYGMMYRTGDLARLVNGELEYIGRADNQVKITGHRVELGEIESTICQYPGVRHAAVVYGSALHAYFEGKVSTDELHAFLASKLPAYMVPVDLWPIDTLPLTENGKVDRKKLEAL